MGRSSRTSFLLGLGTALLLLVSCAAAVDVKVQCLPMVIYTQGEQTALSLAYDALPQGSILRRAVQDYLALRDADRACQQGSKP